MKALFYTSIASTALNLIVVVVAVSIAPCHGDCSTIDAAYGAIIRLFIDFGLVFPRVAAYRLIQIAEGYSYPWPSLAFSYGVMWTSFLVQSAIIWPQIVLSNLRKAREADFSKPVKVSSNFYTIHN